MECSLNKIRNDRARYLHSVDTWRWGSVTELRKIPVINITEHCAQYACKCNAYRLGKSHMQLRLLDKHYTLVWAAYMKDGQSFIESTWTKELLLSFRQCLQYRNSRNITNSHIWTRSTNSITKDVKQSYKIWSSIYTFEFEFSFLAFAIRFVTVPRGRAFNKPHSCIVRISNAWLCALHRQPARWNAVT